jgi:amino acid transporter
MSVRGALFLGVGSMVGAGIFALLGEAGAVAGAAVWLSFLLAGIVAGLLGYTVVKLGVRYPSSGGLIAYLVEGFGNGRLVGIASWLGYMSAIVIVGAMVAVSFGSYATSLFVGPDAGAWWDNAFTSAVIAGTLCINLIGSRIVDKAQSLIVVVELCVFAVFIGVTLPDADWGLLAFSGYPPLSDIVASVALTFFAFMGFSVITFSAGDLADPARGLPRAMYTALAVTGGLYILIAFSVFGTLTTDEVVRHGETAIAEAARPALGDAGFTMMALAAILATTSSVNATLYASDGLTRMLASVGQFPPLFGRQTRGGAHVGLLLTAVLILLVGNLVDLSAIASLGSAIALCVFVLVALAGYRRRADTGANPVIALTAIGVSLIVLGFFAVDTLRNAPATFAAIVALAALAVVLDAGTKRAARRRAAPPAPATAPA